MYSVVQPPALYRFCPRKVTTGGAIDKRQSEVEQKRRCEGRGVVGGYRYSLEAATSPHTKKVCRGGAEVKRWCIAARVKSGRALVTGSAFTSEPAYT